VQAFVKGYSVVSGTEYNSPCKPVTGGFSESFNSLEIFSAGGCRRLYFNGDYPAPAILEHDID
jgi:hypothetical protein